MKQEISTLIYDTLKGIVEIYPVLADVEDSKNLPVPYAIYQLKESGNKTKETVKKVYDTGIFIVTDTYEIAWEIIHKVEEAINLLDRSSICVSAITGEVKYDGEDRRYVGEMSFTINYKLWDRVLMDMTLFFRL